MITYVADMETTYDFYDLNDNQIEYNDYINLSEIDKQSIRIHAREYAIGTVQLDNENVFFHVKTIEDWFKLMRNEDSKVYFHNLKFDGKYIISYLLNKGFIHSSDRKEEGAFIFKTLIDGHGTFYSIDIYFNYGPNNRPYKMKILDSAKLIQNMAVKDMPKNFGLDIEKLDETYDYNKRRDIGYELSEEEIKYLKHDCVIVARVLNIFHKYGMDKMTIASNALAQYKKTISKNEYKRAFHSLSNEVDFYIRASYKGGYTYLNKNYAGKEVDKVLTIDVNSLYPSVMYDRYLPYGQPLYFEGEYEYDSEYPLYVQKIICSFSLKENKLPTIQVKNSSRFTENEYLESSDEELVELTLTNIDLELFLEHYENSNLVYVDGYKFKQTNKLFKKYIDYWSDVKVKSKDINKGMYSISKYMLNSLYGKFGTNPIGTSKVPSLYTDGLVRYDEGDNNDRDTLYIPIASFITSYAKNLTIRTAQLIYDYSIEKYGENMFIYSDTDSIHTRLSIEELKEIGIDIDSTKLGAWDNEGISIRSKYIKQKTYITEMYDNKKKKNVLKITCAGMPKSCHEYVTFDNFKVGSEYEGKLMAKTVIGGTALLPTNFSIK